jgi:hypothetical protein
VRKVDNCVRFLMATALIKECSVLGEYSDWPELKTALLSRLDEVVAVFQSAENRRLALVAGGVHLSDPAKRTVLAGLNNLGPRTSELRAALMGFTRRCVCVCT